MPRYKFDRPLSVRLGSLVCVSCVDEARAALMHPQWPRRGPWHEDALYTTIEVMEGSRPLADARLSFRDAARESGILITG